MSTYTIGETAERSGFSTSALRYYEGIGLVAPAERTGSGYRLYDDDTLDRLAFIARAKQLGCTLEEITDLVGIWDGENCGPVQRRLHDLVTSRLTDAERQIAELTVLTDQLRQAALLLAGPPTDGPCSTTCACTALGATARGRPHDQDRRSMTVTTAPIVCTAGTAEIADRLETIERMHDTLDQIERTPNGLILHFPNRPEIEADVRHFAIDEKGCCQFWGFAIDTTAESIDLRWDGPPDVQDFLDELLDYFNGDDPGAIAGLL